mgnify:FL=1
MKIKLILVTVLLVAVSCTTKKFNQKWLDKKAPETFKARFETTQGNFDIEAKRVWSPKGVDRLYQLIKYGYYNDVAIYRVVPNFVAQFGIHNDSLINASWREGIEDEPVVLKNDAMTISFARGAVKTRSNQIFINLKDNNRLDTADYSGVVGFPAVAKITAGKDNVSKFHDGYGDRLGTQQGKINKFGNAFLREKYPKVDYIIKAYLIK